MDVWHFFRVLPQQICSFHKEVLFESRSKVSHCFPPLSFPQRKLSRSVLRDIKCAVASLFQRTICLPEQPGWSTRSGSLPVTMCHCVSLSSFHYFLCILQAKYEPIFIYHFNKHSVYVIRIKDNKIDHTHFLFSGSNLVASKRKLFSKI